MENGKESVYPSEKLVDSGHPMLDSVKVKTSGITKREYFAGLAMQGILASNTEGLAIGRIDIPGLIQSSVEAADKLLIELEKSKSE